MQSYIVNDITKTDYNISWIENEVFCGWRKHELGLLYQSIL